MARYRIQVVETRRPSSTSICLGRSDWRVVAGVGYRDSAVSLCASAAYIEPGTAPGCGTYPDIRPGTACVTQRQEAAHGESRTQPPDPGMVWFMYHGHYSSHLGVEPLLRASTGDNETLNATNRNSHKSFPVRNMFISS